ncbi:MAG: hypothetical protein WCF73_03500, partial [Candidatus Sulfotelmatobacter sp.]
LHGASDASRRRPFGPTGRLPDSMATVMETPQRALHDYIADISGHTDVCAAPPIQRHSSDSRSKQSNTALTDAK